MRRSKEIVLIEDDHKMLSLLTTLLQMEGYDILPLPSQTEEAIISSIENEKPAAVVLDVHLLDTDGIDLLKSIRTRKITPRPKVLMTSGEDLSQECLAAGADGFLLKPYLPGDLIDWLNDNSQADNTGER